MYSIRFHVVALCTKYGGSEPRIRVPLPITVSFFDAALHNALVGCIQETWAAVLEEYQSQNTRLHKRIQHRIARDEGSHAQLAWDIHDFFMSKLADEERSIIIEQMEARIFSNDIEVVDSFPRSKELGIPSVDMQHQLYHEFSKLMRQRIRQSA